MTLLSPAYNQFAGLIADRTRDFVGRAWMFAAIDAWLAGETAPSFFIITGEPGIGKTAIAARVTQRYDMRMIIPTSCMRSAVLQEGPPSGYPLDLDD